MLQPPFYLPSKIRMLWVIRFHPSHRLFSRLRNHSTVSLTILLVIRYLFVLISSNLVNRLTRCKHWKQRSGWDGPLSTWFASDKIRYKVHWCVLNFKIVQLLQSAPLCWCCHFEVFVLFLPLVLFVLNNFIHLNSAERISPNTKYFPCYVILNQ